MLKNKTVRNVFFAVFCLFACISLGHSESCSTAGQVQYKYTASGCSYTTQTRTCCSDKKWSDYGKSCSDCTLPAGYTYVNGSNPPVFTRTENGLICGYYGSCTPSGNGWSFSKISCNCPNGDILCSGLCEKKQTKKIETASLNASASNLSTCQEVCFNQFTAYGTKSAQCSFYGITQSDADGSVCSCDKVKGCVFSETISGTISKSSANMCTCSAKFYACS